MYIELLEYSSMVPVPDLVGSAEIRGFKQGVIQSG